MAPFSFLYKKPPQQQQQTPQQQQAPAQPSTPAPSTPAPTPTPSTGKKVRRKGTGLSTTGYTIFSAEHNKIVSENYFNLFYQIRRVFWSFFNFSQKVAFRVLSFLIFGFPRYVRKPRSTFWRIVAADRTQMEGARWGWEENLRGSGQSKGGRGRKNLGGQTKGRRKTTQGIRNGDRKHWLDSNQGTCQVFVKNRDIVKYLYSVSQFCVHSGAIELLPLFD